MLQQEHEFDWDNIIILEEPCHNKRLISEMLNIKKTEKKPQLTDRYGGTSQTVLHTDNK